MDLTRFTHPLDQEPAGCPHKIAGRDCRIVSAPGPQQKCLALIVMSLPSLWELEGMQGLVMMLAQTADCANESASLTGDV